MLFDLEVEFKSGPIGHGKVSFTYPLIDNDGEGAGKFIADEFARFAAHEDIEVRYITLTQVAAAINASGDTLMKGTFVGNDVQSITAAIIASISLYTRETK